MNINDNNIQKKSDYTRLCPPSMRFTRRQSECFYYLGRGFSTKRIATALELKPRSVEDHINKIKNKMGIRYKSELIEKAIETILFANSKILSNVLDNYPN